MTAILAFPSRRWNPTELDVLAKIGREIGNHGVATEREQGVTDEGDPWVAVHDTSGGALVAHIARIGAAYVLVWGMERPYARQALANF
jgi:hypothetical protein